jgi:hypothetical protein
MLIWTVHTKTMTFWLKMTIFGHFLVFFSCFWRVLAVFTCFWPLFDVFLVVLPFYWVCWCSGHGSQKPTSFWTLFLRGFAFLLGMFSVGDPSKTVTFWSFLACFGPWSDQNVWVYWVCSCRTPEKVTFLGHFLRSFLAFLAVLRVLSVFTCFCHRMSHAFSVLVWQRDTKKRCFLGVFDLFLTCFWCSVM